MGFLQAVPAGLGIGDTGGKKALGKFGAANAAVAARLRKFRPFRTRSAFGTQRIFQEGDETRFDQDSPFLQGAIDRFQQASEGGSEGILDLLRQRANPEFQRQFGSLENRALQQGRLGLNVGDAGGLPEFASFFGQKNQADLGFQLEAFEEDRRNRKSLFGELEGAHGFLSSELQNLLGFDQLQSGREIAAANIESGGLTSILQGSLSEAEQSARLFGGAISSIGVGPVSASF